MYPLQNEIILIWKKNSLWGFRACEEEKCYYYVSKQSIRQTYSMLKLHFARIFSTFVYRRTAALTTKGKKTYVNIIKRILSSTIFFLKGCQLLFFLLTKSPFFFVCKKENFASRSILQMFLLTDAAVAVRRPLCMNINIEHYLLRESCGTLKKIILIFYISLCTCELWGCVIWKNLFGSWDCRNGIYILTYIHSSFPSAYSVLYCYQCFANEHLLFPLRTLSQVSFLFRLLNKP